MRRRFAEIRGGGVGGGKKGAAGCDKRFFRDDAGLRRALGSREGRSVRMYLAGTWEEEEERERAKERRGGGEDVEGKCLYYGVNLSEIETAYGEAGGSAAHR